MTNWYGIVAPAGVPRDIVNKVSSDINKALQDPGVRKRLVDLAQDIPLRQQQTPDALGAMQEAEIEKWWPIIRAAGIKAE